MSNELRRTQPVVPRQRGGPTFVARRPDNATISRVQLDRADRNTLIIYTTNPAEATARRSAVRIDDFVLISAGPILVAGVVIAGITLVWTIGKDIYDRANKPSSAPGTPGTETRCDVTVRVVIDTSNVQESQVMVTPSDNTGGTTPDSGGTSTPDAGGTSAPDAGGTSTPDTEPSATQPEGGLPGGTPLPDDSNLYVVPTEYNDTSDNAEVLDTVMRGYLGSTFDSPEAALAYLERETTRAGVEIVIGGGGVEARGRVTDPAGVMRILADQGFTDPDAIDVVVAEVNETLRVAETFVQGAQAVLAQATKSQGQQEGGDRAGQSGEPPEPKPASTGFSELVPEWVAKVPAEFALTSSSADAASPSAVSSNSPNASMQPKTLLQMNCVTKSSVRVDARMETETTIIPESSEPLGYAVADFVSVFNEEPDVDIRSVGRLR